MNVGNMVYLVEAVTELVFRVLIYCSLFARASGLGEQSCGLCPIRTAIQRDLLFSHSSTAMGSKALPDALGSEDYVYLVTLRAE